jgi:uncharacterized protein YigE (DUF2233 family)
MSAGAVDCKIYEISGESVKSVTACRFDVGAKKERLELLLRDDAGMPLKTLRAAAEWLKSHGKEMTFGMNGGMFEPDFTPTGLFVNEGEQLRPLNDSQPKMPPGRLTPNFYLQPNGVFLVTDKGAQIVKTADYRKVSGKVRLATQSGPLLVFDDEINPAFNPKSKNTCARNAVGVDEAGKVFFAISSSNIPISFYELAKFFRDELKCRNALFLDGVISSIYPRQLGRDDSNQEFGPILVVTRKVE